VLLAVVLCAAQEGSSDSSQPAGSTPPAAPAQQTTLGAFTAAGISNAYYPQEDRGFGLTISRAGITLPYGSLGGALSGFWPDIERKVFKNKQMPGLSLPEAGDAEPDASLAANPVAEFFLLRTKSSPEVLHLIPTVERSRYSFTRMQPRRFRGVRGVCCERP
jgi:hypothetical protein